jgi:hypothetical protein
MDGVIKKAGRPRLALSDEERRERRRRQVAEAQSRRREKLAARQRNLEERERALADREHALRTRGARIGRRDQSAHTSDRTRTQALIERFTTGRDWRTGERRPVDLPYRAKGLADQAAKLTRQTKAAGTALRTLIHEFKDILGEGESRDLQDAAALVERIGHAAEVAKDKARTLEKRLTAEDAARERTALAAFNAAFGNLQVSEQILLSAAIDKDGDYRSDVLALRELNYSLRRMREEARREAVSAIKETIEAGKGTEEKIREIQEKMHAPELVAGLQESIHRVQAALVQAQLEKAAK